jgi:hypothetical protein
VAAPPTALADRIRRQGLRTEMPQLSGIDATDKLVARRGKDHANPRYARQR